MLSNSPVINRSGKLVVLCTFVLLMGLNACTGLTQSDKPAMKTWWLEPYTQSSSGISAEPVLLSVSLEVVPGLDTDRILTLSESAELNHYSGARWADSTPELLTSLGIRSLESSGGFDIVTAMESCKLDLNVQEFFAVLGTSNQTVGVSVTVKGRYQCNGSELMNLPLTAYVPVSDQRMSAIVAAFQQGLDDVMKDLLNSLGS